MTSHSQTNPGSKRFAKLESIPLHTNPLTGPKKIVASLYIARRQTLSVVAIAISAAFSLAIVFSSVQIAGDLVSDVTGIRQEQLPALPVPTVQEDTKPVAVVETSPIVDDETKPPMAAAEETALAKPLPDVEEAVNTVQGIRMIIPTAEALQPLSVSEMNDVAKVADEKTADLDKPMTAKTEATPIPAKEGPTASSLPIPVDRIPSEAEVQDFFRVPAAEAGVETMHAVEVEEDMSPTLALPTTGPIPSARPIMPLAVATSAKVEFRLVQGPGIKSGFWLGNKEDPNTRRFFVVVAPYLENGTKTSWKFTNIGDAQKVDTDRMAVEVTEEAFAALAAETKEFGKVRKPVLGVGELGNNKIAWSIASEGNLLAGWDKEKK